MKKHHFRIFAGLLIAAGMLATYVACSESTLEDISSSDETTAVGATLKTAVCTCTSCTPLPTADSVYTFSRDPLCTGSCYSHALFGFNFRTDSSGIEFTDLCGSTVSTCSSNYDMYFYNEKTDSACAGTKISGQPLLILDSTLVQAYYVGTGEDTFNSYTCFNTSCSLTWDSDNCFTLPLGTEYRCSASCTSALCKDTVTYLSDNYMQIGNRFQQVTDPVSPDEQRVYLLKIYDDDEETFYYYVFMVYKFQNALTPKSEKMKMVIKYRNLGTCQ